MDCFFFDCVYLLLSFVLCFFFFFRQKPAYERRFSAGSSDVCSSDLPAIAHDDGAAIRILAGRIENRRARDRDEVAARFGEHRLARPAKTGGNRRSRHKQLPKTGHARLLDCLNVPCTALTQWQRISPPCRSIRARHVATK